MNHLRSRSGLFGSNLKIDYLAKANQSQVTGLLKYALANTVFGSFKAFFLLKNKIEG